MSSMAILVNKRHTRLSPPRKLFAPRETVLTVSAEAVVSVHKSGLFTSADYNNLCQCESLEDIKLHLVSVLLIC